MCIAAYLPRLRDVSSFGRVNRHLYANLNKLFYKLDEKSNLPRALVWASIYGATATVELALGAGSDVDGVHGDFVEISDPESKSGKFLLNQGTTPLLGAAAGGHLHIVKRLLDEGADVEWMDEQSLTVLHLAAQPGRENVADLLVKELLEPVYVESDGKLAAGFAGRHKGTLRRILQAMDPCMCAIGTINPADAINGVLMVCTALSGTLGRAALATAHGCPLLSHPGCNILLTNFSSPQAS